MLSPSPVSLERRVTALFSTVVARLVRVIDSVNACINCLFRVLNVSPVSMGIEYQANEAFILLVDRPAGLYEGTCDMGFGPWLRCLTLAVSFAVMSFETHLYPRIRSYCESVKNGKQVRLLETCPHLLISTRACGWSTEPFNDVWGCSIQSITDALKQSYSTVSLAVVRKVSSGFIDIHVMVCQLIDLCLFFY